MRLSVYISFLFWFAYGLVRSQGITKSTLTTSTHNALASIFASQVDEANPAELTKKMGEILGCRVKLKETKIRTTLNVRPTVASIFKKTSNRTYIVRINNRSRKDAILLSTIPPKAQFGLWMHETMHIADYQQRNAAGILQRATQYLSKKGKKRYEHEIDKMVVENGYGYFLSSWAEFAMNNSNASEKYKEYKRSFYLSPNQINHLMIENPSLEVNSHQNEANTFAK